MRDILVGVDYPFLVHSACEEEDEGDECDGEQGFEERVEEMELWGGRAKRFVRGASSPGEDVHDESKWAGRRGNEWGFERHTV
jgi:hypothetical protein